MVRHYPSNTLQTATKYQNTTSIITFMYFCRATVEAIMLFVWDSCLCVVCRLLAHSVRILQTQMKHAHFSHIHRQLLPPTDVELYPFPFQSTDGFISRCQTAISSFNLWLSQTSFPSFWSQWTICGRLPDEDTVCSLSAFSVTDGRSLNCSFNSWATKAQTFILVWYRPVRLIFEVFDLWLAHTGVEFFLVLMRLQLGNQWISKQVNKHKWE